MRYYLPSMLHNQNVSIQSNQIETKQKGHLSNIKLSQTCHFHSKNEIKILEYVRHERATARFLLRLLWDLHDFLH